MNAGYFQPHQCGNGVRILSHQCLSGVSQNPMDLIKGQNIIPFFKDLVHSSDPAQKSHWKKRLLIPCALTEGSYKVTDMNSIACSSRQLHFISFISIKIVQFMNFIYKIKHCLKQMCVCVCACVYACVCACVHACVYAFLVWNVCT